MEKTFKLIVNQKDGLQVIIEGLSGVKYYDQEKVIYDEQVSGPLTKDQIDKLGGWFLDSKGNFTFDQQLFDFHTELVLKLSKEYKLKILEKTALDEVEKNAPLFKIIGLLAGFISDPAPLAMIKAFCAKYEQLKAQIEAAKDLAELDAVIIDFSDVIW